MNIIKWILIVIILIMTVGLGSLFIWATLEDVGIIPRIVARPDLLPVVTAAEAVKRLLFAQLMIALGIIVAIIGHKSI